MIRALAILFLCVSLASGQSIQRNWATTNAAPVAAVTEGGTGGTTIAQAQANLQFAVTNSASAQIFYNSNHFKSGAAFDGAVTIGGLVTISNSMADPTGVAVFGVNAVGTSTGDLNVGEGVDGGTPTEGMTALWSGVGFLGNGIVFTYSPSFSSITVSNYGVIFTNFNLGQMYTNTNNIAASILSGWKMATPNAGTTYAEDLVVYSNGVAIFTNGWDMIAATGSGFPVSSWPYNLQAKVPPAFAWAFTNVAGGTATINHGGQISWP